MISAPHRSMKSICSAELGTEFQCSHWGYCTGARFFRKSHVPYRRIGRWFYTFANWSPTGAMLPCVQMHVIKWCLPRLSIMTLPIELLPKKLWFSRGFPMFSTVFPWFSHVFPWLSWQNPLRHWFAMPAHTAGLWADGRVDVTAARHDPGGQCQRSISRGEMGGTIYWD